MKDPEPWRDTLIALEGTRSIVLYISGGDAETCHMRCSLRTPVEIQNNFHQHPASLQLDDLHKNAEHDELIESMLSRETLTLSSSFPCIWHMLVQNLSHNGTWHCIEQSIVSQIWAWSEFWDNMHLDKGDIEINTKQCSKHSTAPGRIWSCNFDRTWWCREQ